MRKNFKFSSTGNVFLLTFAIFYAVSLVYQLLTQLFFGANIPPAVEWCGYLLNPIVFVAIPLWYAKSHDVNIVSAMKLKGKVTPKQVGIIALLSIFCIMAFLPISNVFLDILSRMGFYMELSLVDTNASVGAYFLGLLLLAVLPAISEEFLIRGAMLNCAEQRRDYSYAILLTASIFSLMHGNPIQTVHQFLLGIVLAYVVLVSRSIWAGVLLHFFNNFLSLSLDYPFNLFLTATGAGEMHIGWWYLIWLVCILIGVPMVLYLLKKFTAVSRDKIKMPDMEVIDVVQNDEGVYVAEKDNVKGKIKSNKNDFVWSVNQLCGIFKKGGLKRAYDNVNNVICEIVEPDTADDEFFVDTPLSRNEKFPMSIKRVYIILIILWLITFITGFIH